VNGVRLLALPVVFGWSRNSSRVAYSNWTADETIDSVQNAGPDHLKTISSDGSRRKAVLVARAVFQASWAADGSLIYDRHCGRTCQLAVRDPGGQAVAGADAFQTAVLLRVRESAAEQ